MIVTSAEDAPRTILLSLLQRTLLPPTSNIITSIIILYFIWMFSIEASQVDVYGVNPTSPTNDPANLIQIQMTVATQKCLHYFTVDESTMHDNLDHGVDSISHRGDPKSWSVVTLPNLPLPLSTEVAPSEGNTFLTVPLRCLWMSVEMKRMEQDNSATSTGRFIWHLD
uniref:Uncharacterized protein n=1 Tax=Psilocybe cubensis TaxID=181762 RepID=A0A8H8CKE5_PSICU